MILLDPLTPTLLSPFAMLSVISQLFRLFRFSFWSLKAGDLFLCLTADNLSTLLVIECDEVHSYSETIAEHTGSKAWSLNWVLCNTMAATLSHLLGRAPRSNTACTQAGSSTLLVLRCSRSMKNLLILRTGFPPVNQKLTANLKSPKINITPNLPKTFSSSVQVP